MVTPDCCHCILIILLMTNVYVIQFILFQKVKISLKLLYTKNISVCNTSRFTCSKPGTVFATWFSHLDFNV